MNEEERKLRVFQFEDDAGDAGIVQFILGRAWELLTTDKSFGFAGFKPRFTELEFDLFASSEAAYPALEGDEFYDLFVFDLLQKFGEDKDTQFAVGPGMAELARRSQPVEEPSNAGIIGISKAEDTPRFRGARGSFEKAARLPNPGPHGTYGCSYFDKSSLFGGSSKNADIKEVAQVLLNVLVDAGVLQPRDPRIVLDLDSEHSLSELRVVTETIGKKTLGRFAERFLGKSCPQCRVRYVRPGFGNANVLRLETQERSLLLKTSRSHDVLQREIDQYARIQEDLREFFVEYREDEVASSIDGEWKAIATKDLEEVETLSERIEAAVDSSSLGGLLRTVFIDGLKKAYQTPCPSAGSANVIDVLFPTRSRNARIHLAHSDLGKLAEDYGNRDGAAFDPQVLVNFLELPGMGFTESELPAGPPELCWSHGDLHGRNILVASGGNKFYLLDPTDSGELHWGADVARLMIDLIVTSWDKGPNSYRWERFGAWRRLLRAIVRWEPTVNAVGKQDEAPNRGVAVALDWFRENLRRVHGQRLVGPEPGGEFQLALAVELMRNSYRLDLPAPKRVLGLVAAHDALLICKNPRRKEIKGSPAFLSYAREDVDRARELRDRLQAEGIDVWLDEDKLQGGDRWREKIPTVMRTCSAVIVCLSPTAVTKGGYVQREIRLAREVADEKPEYINFLIPCLLEPCEAPSSLEGFHQVRLFESAGFELLLRSLRAGHKTST